MTERHAMHVRDLTESEIEGIADARITDGTPYRLADVPAPLTRYVVRDTRTKGAADKMDPHMRRLIEGAHDR